MVAFAAITMKYLHHHVDIKSFLWELLYELKPYDSLAWRCIFDVSGNLFREIECLIILDWVVILGIYNSSDMIFGKAKDLRERNK